MAQITLVELLSSIIEIKKDLETNLSRISEIQLQLLSTAPPPPPPPTRRAQLIPSPYTPPSQPMITSHVKFQSYIPDKRWTE